jgi:hypothetical protein
MTVDQWEQRMLCPEGNCVGVIGDDGKCKVCGHVVSNWGDPRQPGHVTDRQLCADGACVGVIGKDGRCKVCRRPAHDAPPRKR